MNKPVTCLPRKDIPPKRLFSHAANLRVEKNLRNAHGNSLLVAFASNNGKAFCTSQD
jgi:hypothetical protein